MRNKYYFSLKIISLCFLLTVFLLPSFTSAQSLWVDRTATQGNMFADRQARNVGDIITILISESTSASTSGNVQNSKCGDVNMRAGSGWLHFLTAANAGYSDNFRAQGSQSNTNRVQGRVTVTVTEVMDNGLLLVSGSQSIKQNREEQKITVTGLIRPEDVSSNNTILSNQVANAEIKIEGKGPIGRKQRQGILTQIFNIIF